MGLNILWCTYNCSFTCMREVCENSLDHIFRRYYVFQSISRMFHHTQCMHTHAHTGENWGGGRSCLPTDQETRNTCVMSFQPNKPRLLRLGEHLGMLCFDGEGEGGGRLGRCGGSDDCVGSPGSSAERG